jgi:hypothetical protein
MIAMGLILSIITFGIGLVLGIPLLLFLTPVMTGLFYSSGQLLSGTMVVGTICIVFYIPLIIVANGILTNYVKSSWTLTYLRLTLPPAQPTNAISTIPPAAPLPVEEK